MTNASHPGLPENKHAQTSDLSSDTSFFLQLKLPASPNISFMRSQLVNFSPFRNAEWISVLNVALVTRYSSNAFSRQHSTAELAEHDNLWTILDPGFQEFVDETFGRLLRCVQLAGSY